MEFRYQRDPRFPLNRRFLAGVRKARPCITVYNLMEFLGQMSFNLAAERLYLWEHWLCDAYALSVLWPDAGGLDGNTFFRQEIYELPLSRMEQAKTGLAFHDALIIALGERTPEVDTFVTWNARHFVGKTNLKVLTPEQYVQGS